MPKDTQRDSWRYDIVFFDWDGTLARTTEEILNAYQETLGEYDIDVSRSDICQLVMGDWSGPLKVGLEESELDAFNSRFEKALETYLQRPKLFQHAENLLQLSQRHAQAVALVTTAPRDVISSALQRHSLEAYFDTSVTGDEVSHHKPHPESLLLAYERLGFGQPRDVVLERTVMIGDSRSDLGAAQELGIDSVLFFPEEHELLYDKKTLIETYEPTHVVSSHAETLEILQGK